MRETPPQVGSQSPWGRVQHAAELAPGIVQVSTASHGGIWIAPDLERQIPLAVRAVARQYAPAQWYEEDCDVAIVGATFAERLRASHPDFVTACQTIFETSARFAAAQRGAVNG